MKRIRSLLIVAAVATAGASAQNIEITLGGGLATQYSSATNVVGAFKIGAAYEAELSQSWALAPQLSFYSKGWKDPEAHYSYTIEQDGRAETYNGVIGYSTTAYYVALAIPVRYYARIGGGNYFFAQAGGYIAVGIGGKMKTKGDPEGEVTGAFYYDQGTFSSASDNSRLDAGIQAGVGLQFPSGLQIGLESDFGLAKIQSTDSRNISALVTLSYHFALDL